MRAVVQRVSEAWVRVDDELLSSIDAGLLVLLGIAAGDTEEDAAAVADKLIGLRIFPDSDGKMNCSVVDTAGSLLVVSQFTVLADVRKGRRPSFVGAAHPEAATKLLDFTIERLRAAVPVFTGRFGAKMDVGLVNDGPVTIVLDTLDGRVV